MKFSKYPKGLHKEAKRLRVPPDVAAAASLVLNDGKTVFNTDADVQNCLSFGICAASLVKSKWHNIYINSEGLLRFLSGNKIKPEYFEFYEDCRSRLMSDYPDGLCLHVPNQKDSHFFSFFDIHKYQKDKNSTEIVSGQIFIGVIQGGYINSIPSAPIKDIQETQTDIDESFSLLLNLMLYMDIFPECVINGCPSVNKSPSNINLTVGLSDKIAKSDISREVSPHMRMGHFRVLKSERFTNKRFQAVYVKPCMVKGRAETVIDLQQAHNGG